MKPSLSLSAGGYVTYELIEPRLIIAALSDGCPFALHVHPKQNKTPF